MHRVNHATSGCNFVSCCAALFGSAYSSIHWFTTARPVGVAFTRHVNSIKIPLAINEVAACSYIPRYQRTTTETHNVPLVKALKDTPHTHKHTLELASHIGDAKILINSCQCQRPCEGCTTAECEEGRVLVLLPYVMPTWTLCPNLSIPLPHLLGYLIIINHIPNWPELFTIPNDSELIKRLIRIVFEFQLMRLSFHAYSEERTGLWTHKRYLKEQQL